MPPRKFIIFRFAGLAFPIPRWTVFFFGICAIAVVGGTVYRHFYPIDLVAMQQALHLRDVEIQEYGRHLADSPRQAYDADDITVRIFPDLCLLILRKADGAVLTKLVPDLRRADFSHKAGDEIPKKSEMHWPELVVPLHAAEQGRCLNPHPGNDFQSAYGRRDGCWVEVWRRWPDGCEHVQMLNTCTGYWDSDQYGRAKVRWVHCRH